MLYIASDHGGYKLKEELKKFFLKQGIEYADLGPEVLDKNDDYPPYAAKVAAEVSKQPKNTVGLLICRSGQGVSIVANKFKGVRSALVWNAKEAKASRHDDFANVLSLPADYITVAEARKIIKIFLQTPFGTEERHKRRIREVENIERNNLA